MKAGVANGGREETYCIEVTWLAGIESSKGGWRAKTHGVGVGARRGWAYMRNKLRRKCGKAVALKGYMYPIQAQSRRENKAAAADGEDL